jgi:hypothetical protein
MILQLALIAAASFFGGFCGAMVGTMWAFSYRDIVKR